MKRLFLLITGCQCKQSLYDFCVSCLDRANPIKSVYQMCETTASCIQSEAVDNNCNLIAALEECTSIKPLNETISDLDPAQESKESDEIEDELLINN